MRSLTLLCLAAVLVVPALADWDPGDGHKMHFPQLPDEQGWDVNATLPKVLADDWMCSKSGWVEDIHFWGSFQEDLWYPIDFFYLSIHANDPGPPSKPVNPPLWERIFVPGEWTERLYGTGDQGWYDPNTGYWYRPDHFDFYQYNFVDIPEPFYQEEGEIYWLDVSAVILDPYHQWGWKTTRDHWMDDAVWGDVDTGPDWQPLYDPETGETLDMAFVITPEPASICLLGLGLVLLRRR
jgi:hypothetical protein